MVFNRKSLSFQILLAVISMVLMVMAGQCLAAPPDSSGYARMLSAHVHDGVVDYAGFKKDEADLDRYLAVLDRIDPAGLDRADQMAFYINAYNAWTIKLILTGYPGVKSIKNLGSLFRSPWKKKFVQLNGRRVTLDHIEHDILRPVFKDPRVHFAVNCASKSCPPLLDQPYEGRRLDEQLDRMTRRFLNDPSQNYLDGDILYVSSIFDWFAKDFDKDIIGFFKRYAGTDLKQRLDAADGRINVKYLDYDWSLNGQ